MHLKKKSKIALFSLLLICLFLAISLAMCTTFPSRDPSFESKVADFVQQNEPGSQLSLLNGRNLAGWSAHGLGRWTVNDGVLKISGGLGYISTRCDDFEDFVLSLDIRAGQKSNSGVFFRARLPDGFRPWPEGYEAQIDNHDPKNPTGSLYDRAKAKKLVVKDGEWFRMQITAIGPNISVMINDEIVTEATDTTYQKGFIALQAHDPFSTVEFRSIEITIPEN